MEYSVLRASSNVGKATEFHPGFNVYRNGHGCVFVVPHSGPSFSSPNHRDTNAETIASICWEKRGGTLIASTMPRQRDYGIDLNRDVPPLSKALAMHNAFRTKNLSQMAKYQKRYAWVAGNRNEHMIKLRTYRNFWNTVIRSGKVIFLIHSKFSRVRSLPSIMDITMFDNSGVGRERMEEILQTLNSRNKKFFDFIRKEYIETVVSEERKRLASFQGSHSAPDYETFEMLDENLQSNFAAINNPENVEAPRITLEHYFKGFSWAPRKNLVSYKNRQITSWLNHGEQKEKKGLVIQIESDRFLNKWYPTKAAELICDILKELDV